ncbi:MAG TPA: AAA family ATPase [Actinokineospora sp.]|nr:AAA family ATPase [Actinokineospora sp.]
MVGRSGSSELIGRDAELAALTTAAKWAPSVVVVEGEAGVGKSRLVAELLVALRGDHWAAVRHCTPPKDQFPFGVIVDLLCAYPYGLDPHDPVAGVLRPYLPELADRLPPEPAPCGDAVEERRRVRAAMRAVLSALGRVTLVVEDVQWADRETAALLRSLTLSPLPNLALVLTFRPEELVDGRSVFALGAPRLVLERLDPQRTREMVLAMTGAPAVSDEFVAALGVETQGLPFLIEEFVGSLADPSVLTDTDPAALRRELAAAPVPPWVQSAAADRLSGLSAAAGRAIARTSAVIGRAAPATVLSPTDTAALDELCEKGLVFERAGQYDYRYPVMRRAVYATLTGPERAQLHRQALRALVGSAPVIELARHAKLGGAVEDWLRYGERAAREAWESGDEALGMALLCELIADPRLPHGDVARLITPLCREAVDSDRHQKVIAVLERVLADPRLTENTRAEVATSLGLLMVRTPGSLVRSGSRLRSALNAHAAADEGWMLRGLAVFGMPYLGVQSIEECGQWQAEVAERLSRLPLGTARTTVLASTLHAQLTIGYPDAETAIALLPDRPPRGRDHLRQFARAMCNLGDACGWLGDTARARRFLDRGLDAARAASAPYLVSVGESTSIRLDWMNGAWTGLAERVQAILNTDPQALAVVSELRLVRGWLALARGDTELAERCFLGTRMSEPDNAVAPVALAATGGMIVARLERGDIRAAVGYADQGMAVLRRQRVWAWAADLVPQVVEAYVVGDRVDDAARAVDEMAAGLVGIRAPFPSAAVTAARAEVALATGSPDQARELFDDAATRCRSPGLRYHAARWAERAELCGTPSVESMRLLLGRYEALGAAKAAARCRRLIRVSGAAITSRRGRRGYGDRLSPREADVAELLASGQTNREIAATMCLAKRTVEDHVAKVLRKLDVDSRAALIRHHSVPLD